LSARIAAFIVICDVVPFLFISIRK